MMDFPARDIFQGYPTDYTMNRSRMPPPRPSYGPSAPVGAHYLQTYEPSASLSHQPELSPVFEQSFRPSLPSISNLLDIASSERPPTRDKGVYRVLRTFL